MSLRNNLPEYSVTEMIPYGKRLSAFQHVREGKCSRDHIFHKPRSYSVVQRSCSWL